MRKENDEIKEIKDRFKPIEEVEQLFEYKVDGIKEKFIIKVFDTNPGKEDATIRITPVIYEGYGEPTVLHLPLSEISPQFDLKNTLVQELIDTLREFKESLFNTPIDKPGIQHFIMLRLSFILDMPRICMLFLKGATEKKKDDFSGYKLSDDTKINVIRINIFSHNIGGFLRNNKVKQIMEDMGREDELDEWYDLLAEGKLGLLLKNKRFFYKSKLWNEDIQKLKKWFGKRYKIELYWKAVWGGRTKNIFAFPKVIFEFLIPRLFIGLLFGSLLFFSFSDSLWEAAYNNRINLSLVIIGVFSITVLFFYTRLSSENIGKTWQKRVWITLKLWIIMLILSLICVFVISYTIGEGFIKEIKSYMNLCPQLIIFWIVFSIFFGYFVQLFWREEKITEPI